ncbi:MAG: hypothetical protein ACKV2U_13860 [Bryobacteraceae bacterium]
MRIRPRQLDSLAAGMRSRFAKDIAEHLRDRYADRLTQVSDDSLEKLANRAIQRSARYNVTLDYDVQRYAEYMVEYGIDFDVHPQTPWASRTLNGNETGTEKMNALDAFTTFELRRRPA